VGCRAVVHCVGHHGRADVALVDRRRSLKAWRTRSLAGFDVLGLYLDAFALRRAGSLPDGGRDG
jgi:hypothetical protein